MHAPLATDRTNGTAPLADETVTVVGGGFGGLATACYLADAGADVTVREQHERVGGVAGLIERDGFRFDTGPSWYLMPDTFERFFGHFDREPSDYYDLTHLDPHYRVFWKDGDSVALSDDRDHVRSVFESYESGAGEAFDDYLDEARHTYEVGMERFVYEDRRRLRDFLDPEVVKSARGLTFLGSMQDHVEEYVDHPKLQQLLQYTLVFLGGSPYNTPALYNLMAHVDFDLGVYYPDGGIYSVVEGMADLARELGATVETDAPVEGIEVDPEGLGVLSDGDYHVADRVVANANPAHVERDLLPPDHRSHAPGYWDEQTYAPSAFMLYLGVEGDVGPLEHHSLVLPTDWESHFEAIFEEPRWPEDPSYYLSVTSKTDDAVAPEGHHAVVILVPIAPGLPDGREVRAEYRDKVLADLAENVGVDLRDRVVVEESACVSDFAERFQVPGGTALGLAHTLTQTGPLRPGHRDASLDRLYYAGSFTTPGIGMPMTLVSGEHAAEAVVEDATSEGVFAGLLG
jgi:phytoene desaturase